MNEFRRLMINQIDQGWSMVEDIFDKYYINSQRIGNNIPKKIHQIWLGGEFPEKYKRIRDTWLDKNPDWEYHLWKDDDVTSFNLENIDNFNRVQNLGSKSDIFRYEILYRFGGLYIDIDFECLKSFNDLIYLDFFAGTGHVSKIEFFNGLIACKPKHPIIKNLIYNLEAVNTNNFDNILNITGPRFFTSAIIDHIKTEENIVIFPTVFFYPFPAVLRYDARNDSEESRKIIHSFVNEKSYCVHLWYTSWQN